MDKYQRTTVWLAIIGVLVAVVCSVPAWLAYVRSEENSKEAAFSAEERRVQSGSQQSPTSSQIPTSPNTYKPSGVQRGDRPRMEHTGPVQNGVEPRHSDNKNFNPPPDFAPSPDIESPQATPGRTGPSGKDHSSGPPAGTVRVQSGPMHIETGIASAYVAFSPTPQTFQFKRTDGSVETIENALVFSTIGLNEPVTVIRAGSQPVQGAFTDPGNRFFNASSRVDTNIPVDEKGVFTMTVVFARADSLNVRLTSNSPIEISGLVINSLVLLESNFHDMSAVMPQSFYVDVPLPGQPLNLIGGKIEYSSSFALYQVLCHLSFSRSSGFEHMFRLRDDGSIQFDNTAGAQSLAQGDVSMELMILKQL